MSQAGKQRIVEALAVLKSLGLPTEQHNERSALTLLALLGIAPAKTWAEATSPSLGVTPIMDFADREYGVHYAPNSRETFRRFTLHQFLEAGLVAANPDKPDRAVNSPKFCYQIQPAALLLLREFATSNWEAALAAYVAGSSTLAARYAQERRMQHIPVKFADGTVVTLTPGGQNPLIREIIEQFLPRYAPGGTLIYIGDTGSKWAHFSEEALSALGVSVGSHGKMPDVVIHHVEKNWLILVEAVTSHGPVNPKRMAELKSLFGVSSAGLVFVTAFADRQTLLKYLPDVAWETEVWVADAPDHLIHFNGERFLGPY